MPEDIKIWNFFDIHYTLTHMSWPRCPALVLCQPGVKAGRLHVEVWQNMCAQNNAGRVLSQNIVYQIVLSLYEGKGHEHQVVSECQVSVGP